MIRNRLEAESIAIVGIMFWILGGITGIIAIFLYPLVRISLFSFIIGIIFEIWAVVLHVKNC